MLEPLFAWASSIGLPMDEAAQADFEAFAADLYAYNREKNLTRIPEGEAWHRHFADSLLFQDLIPMGASIADLGSGPGFPAWPLARVRPDLKVTAVDSNGKMLDFLRRHPLPNLTVVQARAEEWPMREKFDVVTGRAVAPLAIQLELSAPLCRIGGLVLPLRTPGDAPRAVPYQKLGLELERVEDRPTPGGDPRRCPVYKKTKGTDAFYPRRWSEMKSYPLE